MGCRLSGSLRRQQEEQIAREQNWQNEVRFAATDVVEIQTILWNMLVLEGPDRPRSASDLRRLIEDIRQSADEMGWVEPPVDELACRLLVDTIEREEHAWELHMVRKLETEEQVLDLIFARGEDGPRIKPVALEVLLQWYVHTADCESMLRHVELSRAHAASGFGRGGVAHSAASSYLLQSALTDDHHCEEEEEEDDDPDKPKDSLQSFVWRGSPDLLSSSQADGGLGGRAVRHSIPASASRVSRASIPLPPTTPVPGPGCSPRSPSVVPIDGLASGAASPASSPADGSPQTRPTARSRARSSRGALATPPPDDCPERYNQSLISAAPTYQVKQFAHSCALDHNAVYLQQLCLCLRGAMRTALRQFSTSHFDDRGMQQRSAAQKMAGAEWSKDRGRAIARCGSLSALPQGGLLLPPSRQYSLTVVLDLDETLVFARQGPLWVRPGVQQFLHDLRDIDCEVVCWTASNRSYAGGILSRLDPMGEVVSQCIYSHPKWQRRTVGPQVKNLALVGRDLDYTIIVDNLPDSIVGNEMNAIVVENYEGCELHDSTLPTLVKVFRDLIASGLTVPDFLRDRSKSGQHLKYCEQRLVSQESIWCFVLNSEPARFSMPI
eukprot:TRINITY_DN13702_c1_g1_i1.p1 TRINITY_DN13702_c1_g1~~TRINITY_DN13702_c1_g1_i1.p1  ORF type:complete len:610 (+),score=184.48 TRINITY_DN13702_c1_g1_i1:140-1969(+)